MQVTTEQIEREAKRTTESAAAFQRYMERNEVKLMLSMVPATEPPELLTTLLRAAFDAGSGYGEGAVAGEMITAIFKGMDKDKERRGGGDYPRGY